MRENDPQFQDALEIETKRGRELLPGLPRDVPNHLYPRRNGLTEKELDPKYVANQYEGEKQINEALFEVYKYRPDADRQRQLPHPAREQALAGGDKEVIWVDDQATRRQRPVLGLAPPQGPRRPPRRDRQARPVARPRRRILSSAAPSRKPPAAVDGPGPLAAIRRPARSSSGSRRCHADRVHIAERRHGRRLRRRRRSCQGDHHQSRLPLLPRRGHDAASTTLASPTSGATRIELKYRFFQDGDRLMCELRAIPTGEIRYTVGRLQPDTSGQPYSAPFAVPNGAKLILARGSANGIRSEEGQFDVSGPWRSRNRDR